MLRTYYHGFKYPNKYYRMNTALCERIPKRKFGRVKVGASSKINLIPTVIVY